MYIPLGFFCFLLIGIASTVQALPSSGIPAPQPPLGTVSNNGIVAFEDVKKLSPEVIDAVKLLRAHEYKAAELAFQRLQQMHPQEELAYKGEIEASQCLNSLAETVSRYRQLISYAEHQKPHGLHHKDGYLAVLHYAIGEALMMQSGYYPKFIAENINSLNEESKNQLLAALHLNPQLLVAHFSLAAYYEHHSVEKGSLARLQYAEALRLRPDLFQIRYLHAYTWDRPGIILNEAEQNAQGFIVSEDKKKMPEKAIPEYLALIRDHPKYAPPYYCLADDYWFTDKAKSKYYYEKYLELGDRESNAWKRAKSIVDYMNEHPS